MIDSDTQHAMDLLEAAVTALAYAFQVQVRNRLPVGLLFGVEDFVQELEAAETPCGLAVEVYPETA